VEFCAHLFDNATIAECQTYSYSAGLSRVQFSASAYRRRELTKPTINAIRLAWVIVAYHWLWSQLNAADIGPCTWTNICSGFRGSAVTPNSDSIAPGN
jgi:hypothetical protein